MSGEGASPEYDFSLEKAGELPHFDPDRIAGQAVWPTVNHLWRGDWRQDSYPGDDFMFPGRGVGFRESDVIDIVLSANCYGLGPSSPEEDSEIELRHVATVQIERVATEGLRDVIFHRAHKVEPELMEGLVGYNDLIAKTGIAYAFDTDEPAEIHAFQAIETPSGVVLWVSEKLDEDEIEATGSEVEPEIEDDEYPYEDCDSAEVLFDVDKFHIHDVENITAALSILDAPEQCLRALGIIKGQPLAAEVEATEE